MRNFKPSYPFTTAIKVLIPQYSTSHGVVKKTYIDHEDVLNCSFKTYGGSENNNNDLYTIIDTAIVETWYNPILKSDCRIKVLQTSKEYEILGEIENIDMRNQFMKFKVRAILGGA